MEPVMYPETFDQEKNNNTKDVQVLHLVVVLSDFTLQSITCFLGIP